MTIKGRKTKRVEVAPPLCGDCEKSIATDLRRRMGCGLLGADGSGAMKHPRTREPMPTCPQWLRLDPAVSEVISYAHDHKRGTLGTVWELPHRLYRSMSLFLAECSEVEARLNEEVSA